MIESRARYNIGQIVGHQLYGYRGVIVDVDPYFKGTDEWYKSLAPNRPEKGQPWYHVLVHQSDGAMTYAAQTSLEADPSNLPIDHPLIDLFFEEFADGGYIRNNRAFGGE